MEINLKSLNTQQKKAVTHDTGPLLIVAGAGTGKTTVITQRIGHLIEQGKAKGDEILALTFTDKAAGEMEERVDRLLPYGYVDLWISTFHSFAEKILKENALEIGLPNDFKLLNQTQQWLMVRQNLDRFALDHYRPLGNPTKFIHALIKLFSRAKDEVVSPADYLQYVKELKLNADSADFIKDFLDAETLKSLTKKEKKELAAGEIKKAEEVANAFHVYQQLLLENNALDFGDLINYCLELFKKRPLVLARYRRQFKYILVDEFQDTNYAQYEMVKLLAAPNNNITVVGDDDQSVYKFRGASISNILEFIKDYPKAEEIFLNSNYRSTQEILDLSYKFIQQNNPDRLECKLADKEAGKLSKQLIAQNKDQGMMRHLQFETMDDEVRGVLKMMVDLKDKDKEAQWSDFAILARTNDAANYFVGAISQTQIPYQFLASRGLYSKPVVLDVLAYLKLLDNYHEGPAMYRVLSFEVFGLEPAHVNLISYWAGRKGISVYQSLKQAAALAGTDEEAREKFNHILGLIDKHSAMVANKKASEVALSFLEDSGYVQHLTAQDNVAAQQATSHLNQLYKKIREFEGAFDDKSVRNFLNLIELELEAGEAGALQNNLDDGPDSVKITTVHAAKGLEFKYVFIVNLVDRRFPTDERRDAIELPDKLIKEILPQGDAHLQEERRLFYVAMTRAKNGLFFTSAFDCGGVRRKKISKFLAELKALGFPIQDEEKPAKGESLIKDQVKVIGGEIIQPEITSYLPSRFSFSQLKVFETCPYQYRFRHILHVPARGKGFLIFGTSIHSALQRFFELATERLGVTQTNLFIQDTGRNQTPLVSEAELLEIYEKCWVDDWYANRQEHDDYKNKGKKALKDFYKNLNGQIPVPVYLEKPFTLKLEHDGAEYSITGKMDRVDAFDGGIEIIDYKTGRGKTEKTLLADDKEQLLIYQLAAEQVFAEKVKRLSFYYIETNEKISFIGSEKDLAQLKGRIIKTIDEIQKGEFPPKSGMMCQWCDYKGICEFRK